MYTDILGSRQNKIMRVWAHQQRQVHIHTRFPFTHASHSHTLHIHTRFTVTHASHSHTLHIHTRTHTRQPFRIVPHIVLVCLAKGNTGSVKFTFTHAHTRDNLFCGETHLARQHAFPRPIACLASAEGLESENTHIARIENTHMSPVNTLVKGLRRFCLFLI